MPDDSGRALIVKRVPCTTCPYRKDCPAGVWHISEYQKLPAYDDDRQESVAVFLCHLTNNDEETVVCRGWLTVAAESVAARLGVLRGNFTDEERYAPPPVELYATGLEAAEAGIEGLVDPSPRTKRTIERLLRRGHAR